MPRRYPTGYQAEVRQRLTAGERITGPARAPRNGYVRPFAWPNGSSAHARTVQAMIAAGALQVVALDSGRHEVILAEAAS